MKKLHQLLACLLIIFAFGSTQHAAFAQQPNHGPYAYLIAAGDAITSACISATSDANYVANHVNGGGNAGQFNARLNSLGNTLTFISSKVSILESANFSEMSSTYGPIINSMRNTINGALSSHQALVIARSAGLPMPAAAAYQIRDALTTFRDAGPCIRREIQEM